MRPHVASCGYKFVSEILDESPYTYEIWINMGQLLINSATWITNLVKLGLPW